MARTASRTLELKLVIKNGRITDVVALSDGIEISNLSAKEARQFQARSSDVACVDTILMRKLGTECYVRIGNKKVKVPCPNAKK